MAPEDLRPHLHPITTQRLGVTSRQSLIQRYEDLAQISRAMLVAARANDWGRVEALEMQCGDQIEELKAALKQESLSLNEQWQRIAVLRRILDDDAEIRARSEPWLAQLELLVPLGSAPPLMSPLAPPLTPPLAAPSAAPSDSHSDPQSGTNSAPGAGSANG